MFKELLRSESASVEQLWLKRIKVLLALALNIWGSLLRAVPEAGHCNKDTFIWTAHFSRNKKLEALIPGIKNENKDYTLIDVRI